MKIIIITTTNIIINAIVVVLVCLQYTSVSVWRVPSFAVCV